MLALPACPPARLPVRPPARPTWSTHLPTSLLARFNIPLHTLDHLRLLPSAYRPDHQPPLEVQHPIRSSSLIRIISFGEKPRPSLLSCARPALPIACALRWGSLARSLPARLLQTADCRLQEKKHNGRL